MQLTSHISEKTHSSILQVAPLKWLQRPQSNHQIQSFHVKLSIAKPYRNSPFPQKSDQDR